MNQRILFTMLVAALAFAGCSKDATGEESGGSGQLSLDFSVTSEVEVGVVESRATGTITGVATPTADQFSLTIYPEGIDPNAASNFFLADITQYDVEERHEADDYYARALYGNPATESFGAEGVPAFGVTSSKITVVKDAIAGPVAMEARILHMGVSVDYTDAFKSYFSDYSAVVMRDEAEVLTYAKGEGRVGFLKPGAFDLKINHTRQSNGKTGFATYRIETNANAATWHKVMIGLSENVGGAKTITINWDDTIIDVPVNGDGIIDVGETR